MPTPRLIRHPGGVLLLALATSVPMAGFSAALFSDVRADLKELLPRHAESVVTLENLEKRFGGWSQLSIVIRSPDRAANRRFSDDLVAKVRQLPSVRSARNKLGPEAAFFNHRRLMYVELADLEEIRDRLDDAVAAARTKANPLLVDLDGSSAVSLDLSDITRKYKKKAGYAKRFPDGYFESKDGTELAVIVRKEGLAFGIEKNKALVADVEAIIARLEPTTYHPALVVGIGGDVKNLVDEQTSLIEDLVLASALVAVLLALVVVAYFRRIRSLVLVLVPLWVGCTWTFGIAHFAIGYLNASSAFLGPIVPGNGINFGLILLARYFEERRRGTSAERSIETAVMFTLKATSLAALAASIAYGSLMATDFYGFFHFGVIGGIGMICCWLSTFCVMPPLILWIERRWPMDPAQDRLQWYRSASIASLPARLVARRAGLVAWVGLGLGLAASVAAVQFLRDPLEKDFGKLRSTVTTETGSAYWESRVDRIFGKYLAPQVIVADRAEDVPRIVEAIEARIAREGDRAPLTEVTSLTTLIPKDQPEKLAVLADIRSTIDRLLPQLEGDEERAALAHRPPDDLAPFTIADLPEPVRADFRELDGTEGLVVLALPNLKLNLYHADEIARVAELLREIPMPDGQKVRSSGNFVIYDDMLKAVGRDGPTATLYSFFGVLLLLALAYRRPRRILLVSSALLLGVVWLFALLGLLGIRINFLNFIGLPITFGIGVDYGVNVFTRYLLERRTRPPGEAAPAAIASTGGAVVLCSLTTIIGYASLLLARNGALISFGRVAVLGELTCLAAALLVLPAWAARVDR